MSDKDDLFRVVFVGNLTGEYTLDRTKSRFGKVFRLSADRVDKIFDGKEIILKKNVAESLAMDFAVKLAEIGCETYIELMPSDRGYEEKRRTIRRIRYRRGPRQGAIVPDRRFVASLRQVDLDALARNGDFPGNTVKEVEK
jgi:hypothetical protein